MLSFNKFNAFIEAVARGKHDLGADTLMIALTDVAPTTGDSVLADLTEISYANLSSRVVTVLSAAQVGGIFSLVCDDLVMTASGAVGPFRYVTLYNDSAPSKELIGWWDSGGEVLMASNDTYTWDVGAAVILGVVTP